jgi:GNAT superfamily N-acetyltransferase
MAWTLRPARMPLEYAAIAGLASITLVQPITAVELAAEDAALPSGSVLHYIIAADAADDVLGYARAQRYPNTRAGKLYIAVAVREAERGRGIGSALYNTIEAFARECGATLLVGDVRDDDPGSLAFVERRGFGIRRHGFDAVLDLTRFDASRFAGVVADVQAGGIRFLTAAVEPGAAAEHRLYELCRRTFPDLPGYEADVFMSFATWRRFLFEGAGKYPEFIIIAADGERYVGLTVLQQLPDQHYTPHTSVDPEYRGRGIGLALKLVAIDAARRRDADKLRTGNDSRNAAILAINRKLGYVPIAGAFKVARELAAKP